MVKVSFCGELKRIKMPDSLLFDDLRRLVESSNWAQKLPSVPFKYYNEEDGFTIAIDDQISFREAIKYCVRELNSSTLRLYIATNFSEADALIKNNEARLSFNQAKLFKQTEEEAKIVTSSAMSADIVIPPEDEQRKSGFVRTYDRFCGLMNDSWTAESFVIEEEVIPYLNISQRLAEHKDLMQFFIDQVSAEIISENLPVNQKNIQNLAQMVASYLRLSTRGANVNPDLVTECLLKVLEGHADNAGIRVRVAELATVISGKADVAPDSHMSSEEI